jgi:TfoX/Sxy family transcriptional regulator of competence genes
MAYDEKIANRIRQVFDEKNVSFEEKTMFMGVCFMVDDKMCCCTHIDKDSDESVLLCRLSPEEYEAALAQGIGQPMQMGQRIMKNYVFVPANGFKNKKDLTQWVQKCLDFNPLAKKSKK